MPEALREGRDRKRPRSPLELTVVTPGGADGPGTMPFLFHGRLKRLREASWTGLLALVQPRGPVLTVMAMSPRTGFPVSARRGRTASATFVDGPSFHSIDDATVRGQGQVDIGSARRQLPRRG